jgi:DNA sulfur modification protein DndC
MADQVTLVDVEQSNNEHVIKLARNFLNETVREFYLLLKLESEETSESFYEKTREWVKEFESLFHRAESDFGAFLDSDTYFGKGVLGIVNLRDEFSYVFEIYDFGKDDWQRLFGRLEWCKKLISKGDVGVCWGYKSTQDLTTPRGVVEDIKQAYLDKETNGIPWALLVSWGKDSTCQLALTCVALNEIPKELRTRPIHLITSDTLVEAPPVLQHTRKNIADFQRYVKAQNLPIQVHVTVPEIDDRYYVSVIGKGYLPPLPGNIRRFCTERLKIRPNSKLMRKLAATSGGKLIAVLGTRYAESTSRATSMKRYAREGRYGVTGQAGIMSYTPIAFMETETVWQCLASTGLPWGNGFTLLKRLYKEASDGYECPLLKDNSTPVG